LNQFRRDV